MAIIEYKGLKIDTDTLTKEDMPTEVFEEIILPQCGQYLLGTYFFLFIIKIEV